MKSLKITLFVALLIALFVSVSSQSEKTPSQKEVNSYETTKTHYELMAHAKIGVSVPTQG